MSENYSIIDEKIYQLIELAKLEGDNNIQIILLAVSAARKSNQDGMLAGKIQEYVKDVLLPNLKGLQENEKASLN